MKLTKSISKILAVIVLSVIVLAIKSGGASAATFNVVTGAGCSLPEAMENIANQAQTNLDCPTPTGEDTINLPAETIILGADLPVVTTPISIIGAGRGVSVVDGGGFSNLFNVSLGSQSVAHTMTFSDFTAYNVSRGGGATCISASASQSSSAAQNLVVNNLDLNNCGAYSISTSLWNSTALIDGVNISSDNTNDTVGIFALRIGEMTIQNSSVSGEAIGVHTFQTPISPGNSSAIETQINVINSTFAGNRLALSLNASNSSNTEAPVNLGLNLYNNTIADNASTSSSGAWAYLGTSGILWATGGTPAITVDMKNNILADNTFNSSVENCFTGTGVTVTSTNNLSDDDCAAKLGGGDFTNASGVAAGLDVLTDNGGAARTMALLIGSAGIDQGVTIGTITTDARGVARPQNGVYDIGAYEKTADNVPDPDPEPEDPNNPGPPGSTQDPETPGVPRTGKLIGALLASISIVALMVLVSKEIIDGRIKLGKSSK